MPVILLDLDAVDNAQGQVRQVTASLDAFNSRLGQTGAVSRQAQSALNAQETAYRRLDTAQQRVLTLTASYESAQRRLQIAIENNWRAQDRLSSATSNVARYQQEAQQTATSLAAAQDRASLTADRLAQGYRSVATAQDAVASAGRRAQQVLNQPTPTPKAPSGTSGSGREGGGFGGALGGALKNTVLYSGVYGALYGGERVISNSLSRNAQYSRLQGTTQAFTGASPAETREVNRYTQQLATSGTVPFGQQQILQGYYGLASADIYGATPRAKTRNTEQINTLATQLAAASGDQDSSGTSAALLSLIGAYGTNKPGVATAAKTYADQLTAAVIKGQYSFQDFAAVVPRARATIGKQAGVSSADLLSYLAAESNVGISADQAGLDFGSLVQQLVRPNAVQRRVAKAADIDLSPGAIGRAGGLGNFLQTLQTRTASLSEPQRATFYAGLLDNRAAGQGLAAVLSNQRNQGIFTAVANAPQQNVAQRAIDAYNQTPGARLANSEAQLAAQFDTMTKSLLPLEQGIVSQMTRLTSAIKNFADAFNVVGGNNPFQFVADTARHMSQGENYTQALQDATRDAKKRSATTFMGQRGQFVQANEGETFVPAAGGRTITLSDPRLAKLPASQIRLVQGPEQTVAYPRNPAQFAAANDRLTATNRRTLAAAGFGTPSARDTLAGAQPNTVRTGPRANLTAQDWATLQRAGIKAPSAAPTPSAAQLLLRSPAQLAQQQAAARPAPATQTQPVQPTTRAAAATQARPPTLPTGQPALATQRARETIVRTIGTPESQAGATTLAAARALTAAQNKLLAEAGLAAAELTGRGTGTGTTAAARIPQQVSTAPPGPGALAAGNESTAVRFAGQQDPLILELRILRRELDAANNEIVALLAAWPDALRAALGGSDVARPNSLRLHGARDAKRP